MKKAFIKHIEYYLPSKVLTNEELLKSFPEWSVEKVAGKIGISSRHIAGPNETSSDMAFKAASKLLNATGLSPGQIDFVMLCTQSPDYFLPTSACSIQNRLGIPVKSGAIDFNQGCSGFVYGLAMAKGLILSGTAMNILLLTSETYSKFLHPKDKVNRTIFGDAAAATLVSDSGIAEIMDFSLGTDGSGSDKLMVKSGGMRHPTEIRDLKYDEWGNPISSDHLFMDGNSIFNFTLDMVPILVEDTLKMNKLDKAQINQFVFHQANKYMLSFLRKKIKIPTEKFYYFLENVGNTVSSTIPIALAEAKKEGVIQSNNNVMIAGFGVGFSWAGTILKYN